MTEEQKFDTSHQIARAICLVSLAMAFCVAIVWMSHRRSAPLNQQPAPTKAATAEPTDPRAYDVEPSTLNFVARHQLFAGGEVTVRNCYGKRSSAKFVPQKGADFSIATMKSPDYLIFGPYIVTVRSSDGKVIATFRLDRTGQQEMQFFEIYIQSGNLSPVIKIYDVLGERFRPLGREMYSPEPLG